ncbi:MAG TPA: 4Fe-4S binding protein [Tepidisphaeraceae bacterium]|jgi:electron transport complex protein RnfC
MKDVTVSDLSGAPPTSDAADPPPRQPWRIPSSAKNRPRFTDPPEFIAFGEPWTAGQESRQIWPLRQVEPPQLGGWIETLRRCGVTAKRHNSPDLDAQLNQAMRRPIDTVLCAALDVDPSAALNSALVCRYPIELAAGVLLISRATNAKRSWILIDHRVPMSWYTLLRKAGDETGMRVEPIINDYPQADPTILLYTMLGRRLRPLRLPTEQGALVLDAAAAIAVGRCALLNESMTQSPIVVRDHVMERSHYLTVPTTMTLGEVMVKLILPTSERVILAGDLLRDRHVSPDLSIDAGELVFHTSERAAPTNPSPCVRCGWCVDACPTRVHPATILEAAQRADPIMAERAGLEACIECGICSYVCPSNLPLLEGIRRIKAEG